VVVTALTRVHGSDRDLLAAIGALRLRVWGPIIGRNAASSRFGVDEHDANAWHSVVFEDGVLVAAGRLTIHRDLDNVPEWTSFGPYADQMRVPLGLAGRLVVHPGHERRGFAERIIVDRLEHATGHGLREVWGETRRNQVGGLTRHGYELVGSSSDQSVPGEWVILRAPLGTSGGWRLRLAGRDVSEPSPGWR
jgi:GNAT superfamily N-acetyltransferase